MRALRSKFLLPAITVGAALTYFPLTYAPAYTRWAVILLILPALFFICRKESALNLKKVGVVCFATILLGIIWDTVAIRLKIWAFPSESVIGWFLGLPLEEYVFAICFPIIILGLYTSLPKFRFNIPNGPRLKEIPAVLLMFFGQILAWVVLLFSNAQSYLKWLFFLAIIPSLFYLWRKGEKIDEVRMALLVVMMIIATLVVDVIFTNSGSWLHYDAALTGRIGVVPIEDVLFSIFTSISIVGLYTSLPNKNLLFGKW